MSPRTGRKKLDNPLNHDIKVRVDDATHKALLEYCEKHNDIKKAELIRNLIVEFLAAENE